MIPVQQEYWGNKTSDMFPGDCLRACVASILHLPIQNVPHFIKPKSILDRVDKDMDVWQNRFKTFFDENKLDLNWGFKPPIGKHCIGVFRIHDTLYHAVVCYGYEIIHDPNPKQHYLRRQEWKYFVWV